MTEVRRWEGELGCVTKMMCGGKEWQRVEKYKEGRRGAGGRKEEEKGKEGGIEN